MYQLKKNWKVFLSKSIGIGPSSYEKRIYRAAVSQMLGNTGLRFLPSYHFQLASHEGLTNNTRVTNILYNQIHKPRNVVFLNSYSIGISFEILRYIKLKG